MVSLLPLLEHPSVNVRVSAHAALGGDASALCGVLDALTEHGELPMLEVGKCYMIKTPTIYYLGRVKSIDYVCVVLEAASEVYETGETGKCWREGKPAGFEAFPAEETVSIPISSIISAISWSQKLPSK